MNRSIQKRILASACCAAAATLLASAPTVAHETAAAVAVDGNTRHVLRYIDQQVSASEARRAAYRYMQALGYSSHSDLGGARVRSITREGDTWIVDVAYSTSGRVLSRRTTLYVDANSALVSETAPDALQRRVASR